MERHDLGPKGEDFDYDDPNMGIYPGDDEQDYIDNMGGEPIQFEPTMKINLLHSKFSYDPGRNERYGIVLFKKGLKGWAEILIRNSHSNSSFYRIRKTSYYYQLHEN